MELKTDIRTTLPFKKLILILIFTILYVSKGSEAPVPIKKDNENGRFKFIEKK